MREKETLTQDQLEALNDGESITIYAGFSEQIELNPPCGDDHDWHAVDYRSQKNELDRRCRHCNAKETIKIKHDELWDAVVNSEHVTEAE